MNRYTIPSPALSEPGDKAINRIQDLRLVRVEKLRDEGIGSTRAWEITFKVPSLQQAGLGSAEEAAIKANQIRAGMQIALLPVNNNARVERALEGLKDVQRPQWKGNMATDTLVQGQLPGRDNAFIPPQMLSPAQILAHTVDLTRPTKELMSLVMAESNENWGSYATLPVEEFVNLEGIRGRLSLSDLQKWQPPLENRKYTPSRVDLKKGEISLMVSDTPCSVQHPDGRTLHCHGSMMGYLSDVIDQFTPSQQPVIHGFLDVRKHKLPYHKDEAPKILIGTGVGIAPHLAYLRECAAEGKNPNVPLMIVGVRRESEQLRDNELRGYLPRGTLQYAYSRPALGEGQYVDTALKANAKTVWQALQAGGSLYLCGREDMRKGVDATLLDIARTEGGKSLEDAKTWLKEVVYNKDNPKEHLLEESMSFHDRFYEDKHKKRMAKLNPENGKTT